MTSSVDLSAYVLETVHINGEFVLDRGKRADNTTPILVVKPQDARSEEASRQRLEHEYMLTDELDPAWAVCPLAFKRHKGRPVLVLADPGGTPLNLLLGKPFEVEYFLKVAISLAGALRQLHARGLVHKDIKPANVFVDTGARVWLTGFGLAVRMPPERPEIGPVIRGTWAYMAPEQTGRVNRVIDVRSDLYSFGITLYEMLTGTLPFVALDQLEWIHCHVARQPTPPRAHRRDIPIQLEAIVLKLLAKSGDDRYQSAGGVEADLRTCLESWTAKGCIDSFTVATADQFGKLILPESLYGRDQSIETLRAAFSRVSSKGEMEIVLVSGPPGVGKSSMIKEVQRVLSAAPSLFATGKADQYKLNGPYAALGQAFQRLIQRLLSTEKTVLDRWRRQLLEALGADGQLIVSLVPELAVIIGDPPPPPDLPAVEAQSRFHLVFKRFLGVFAQQTHPLILFIDDLQWLDAATVELIERLVEDSDIKHLLLIGAYRDDEIGFSDRLSVTLKVMRSADIRLTEVALDALKRSDVMRLIADTLRAKQNVIKPLSKIVFDKTKGNPFFIVQFLNTLRDDGLLSFDIELNTWLWEQERINGQGITDNVADLLTGKLSRLSAPTLWAVKYLSCMGSGARLSTLSLVIGRSEKDTADLLKEAVQGGFLLARDASYIFSHDRMQESAYMLISESERPEIHLQIGRALVLKMPPSTVRERIFDVVDQFSHGTMLIDSDYERTQISELYILAGKRAKAATAYVSALKYFKEGALVLGNLDWDRQYNLAFEIEIEQAECELLCGNQIAAEDRLLKLLSRGRDLVDIASVTSLRIALHTLSNPSLAVKVGLYFLSKVGIEWSPHPTTETLEAEIVAMRTLLGTRKVEELVGLSRMNDPLWLAVMDILASLIMPAKITDYNLENTVIVKMTNLSLLHGNCDASPYAYSQLNVVLGVRFGDYDSGIRFGQLGRDLVDNYGMERFKARVYCCFSTYGLPWMTHLPNCVELNRNSVAVADAVGDLVFVSAAAKSVVVSLLIAGEPLADVQHEAEQYLALAKKAGFSAASDGAISMLWLIHELRGQDSDSVPAELTLPVRAEFELYLEDGGAAVGASAAFYWVDQLQARYLLHKPESAIAAAIKAGEALTTHRTMLDLAEYHFYAALTRGAACDYAPIDERLYHFELLRTHHQKIVSWAENCPENFSCRAALVAAEIARLEGNDQDARRLYDEAVHLAQEYGFIQNEAIANELAGNFYARCGSESLADVYFREALSCYSRWGAEAKVQQIQQRYPHLVDLPFHQPETSASSGHFQNLDIAAVIEMSQAISSEVILDKLVERLMIAVVEYAGAVRGLMLLPQEGQMQIVSEALVRRGGAVMLNLRQSPRLGRELPESLLNYVMRTREFVIIDDSLTSNSYSNDPYITRSKPRSILCMPLLKQKQLVGILYIENNLSPGVFTADRFSVLQIIGSQAAISIENAKLFEERKEAQETARRAEQQTQRLFDMIPALAWRATATGVIDAINQQWIDYTGISAEEAARGEWIRAYPGDEGQTALNQYGQIFTKGIPGSVEAGLRRFDGEIRWHLHRVAPFHDERGEIIHWHGTATDIHDLKRAEDLIVSEKNLLKMNTEVHSLTEILECLVRSVEHQIDGSIGALMLSDADSHRLHHIVSSKLPPRYTAALDEHAGGPFAGPHSSKGENPENLWLIDIANDETWVEFQDLADNIGLKRCWAMPIFPADGSLRGILAVYIRDVREITHRETSVIEQFAHLASVILERKRSEDALTRSRALLAEGQRISHTGSWEWKPKTNTMLLSEECARLLGWNSQETTIPHSAFLECIHPDDRSLVATIHEAPDTEGYYESRHRILLPDGSIRSLQSRGRLMSPSDGEFKEYVGTMVDITEQLRLTQQLRDSLDEKDSLLKEVHHRVKNNLQLISSMLNLQASRIGDRSVSELFAESRNRVRSMAMVHENLYRAGNFSKVSMEDHIKTLSASLIRAYGLNSVNVELITDVEDVLLGIDTAISVGLILNELVSNALKHAFPAGHSGRIHVSLARSGVNLCALVVADNGVGLPCHVDPNNAGSMGLQLVHDLACQLNGSVSVTRTDGAAFSVTFVTEEAAQRS